MNFLKISCLILISWSAVTAQAEVTPSLPEESEATAGALCPVQQISEDHYEVQVGARYVSVIGWTHMTQEKWEPLDAAINAAFGKAIIGKCGEALELLTKGFEVGKRDFFSNSRVRQKLEKSHTRHPLNSVVIEMPQSFVDTELKNRREKSIFLKLIEGQCDKSTEAEKIKLAVRLGEKLFLGPQAAFAVPRNIPVVGGEDQQHFDSAQYIVDELIAALTDVRKVGLKEDTLNAVDKWETDFYDKNLLAAGPISKIVAMENNYQTQKALQRYLESHIAFKQNFRDRNNALVKNTLNQKGNSALVIGAAHVPDLIMRFQQMCVGR